jgi:hypothetical protein
MKNKLFALLGAVALTAVVGCGGPKKPADLPDLYPVKITVIQDGKPLEGASVQLNDPSLAIRFVMGGKTDAQGVAEIKTDAQFPGAPVGKFKVTVSKEDIPELPADLAGGPPTDPAELAEYNKKLAEHGDSACDTVDLQFKKMGTTPAEIEVTTSGAETTVDVGEKVNIPFSESRKSSS